MTDVRGISNPGIAQCTSACLKLAVAVVSSPAPLGLWAVSGRWLVLKNWPAWVCHKQEPPAPERGNSTGPQSATTPSGTRTVTVTDVKPPRRGAAIRSGGQDRSGEWRSALLREGDRCVTDQDAGGSGSWARLVDEAGGDAQWGCYQPTGLGNPGGLDPGWTVLGSAL